jgi:hypothetical protein
MMVQGYPVFHGQRKTGRSNRFRQVGSAAVLDETGQRY